MFKKLTQMDLLRNNLVMFVGSFLTGAVNYLLYPIISRFLSVEEFGEVQILFSLVVQISIVATVVRLFVINTINDEEDPAVRAQFLRNTSRTLYYLSFAISAVFLALTPIIKNALQFESGWSLVPAALSSIFALQFVVHVAYLQSQKKFTDVSVAQLMQAGMKLVIATAFAVIGFGSGGVIWGLVLSGLLTLLLVKFKTKDAFVGEVAGKASKPAFAGSALKANGRNLAVIGLTTLSVFVALSIDTFFVKYLFSPEEAGLYAGVSVVARTLFFLTGSIAAVLIASVSPKMARPQALKTYASSVVVLGLISLPAILIMSIFEERLVRVLVGADYVALSSLLPTLALAMLFVGFINLAINFHIAMKDKLIVFPALIGLAGLIGLLTLSNDTTTEVANSFMYGLGFWLIVIYGWSAVWSLRYGK